MKFKYKPHPKPPKYLYIGANRSPEKRLFVLLCMLGYSQGESFKIAYGRNNIKDSSAAVQASNLMRQKDVQRIAHYLAEAHMNGEWDLNFSMLRPDIIEI